MENNWTIEQTKTLFNLARKAKKSGRGLTGAFNEMSELTGRSVNSVRNYYYSQLKMFELVPSLASDLRIKLVEGERERFELFTSEQIDELLKRVLSGKAQGVSVRKVIEEMADGNSKYALRLQNKYRSMILHHRPTVTAVMKELSSKGIDYYNPYLKEVVKAGCEADNYRKLTDYVNSLDETELGEFLQIMKKFFA